MANLRKAVLALSFTVASLVPVAAGTTASADARTPIHVSSTAAATSCHWHCWWHHHHRHCHR